MYKVTIAMPVYNVGNKVEKALLSALNQTFDSIEYLIVDDKGTDNSMDLVQQIVENHPRGKHVRIIDHGVNKGTGATKNSAMDNASGEYLYFMDSDDVITLDCIEKLYYKATKYNVEIVAASHAICDERLKVLHYFRLYDFYRKGMSLLNYCISGNGCWPVYTWNKLYKLSFLKENEIRCIPHHLCEDIYFSFQIKLNCKSFLICSDITYNYIENPNSLMGQGFNKRLLTQMSEVLDSEKVYLKKYYNNQFISSNYIDFCIQIMKKTESSALISREECEELRKKNIQTLKDYIFDSSNDRDKWINALNMYETNGLIFHLQELNNKNGIKKQNIYSSRERMLHYILRLKDCVELKLLSNIIR